ncbi:MAG: serine hydrolase [Bryobacteraceae bacterium]|nr:serine hydrolase [Bryobacteraceae bacterium]
MRLPAFLAAAACLSWSAPLQMTPQHAGAIASLVERHVAARQSTAVSVAVYAGQLPIWTHAAGKADVENDVTATPKSMFRLASISKPFTAVAVMRLVEMGKVNLDTPIHKYLPQFPKKRWPITLRQLLCHQSGVEWYRGNDMESTRHFPSVTSGLEMFAKDPLVFEPGTRTLYSSYAFNLAGAVIEAVTHRPYAEFVREEVLVPAGIESMRPDDVYAIIPHRASGYRIRNGQLENCGLTDPSYKAPSGGWVATAEDVVRLARALMRGKILKEETREIMWTPQKLKNGAETGYGLGWVIGDEHGIRVIEHSGGQPGSNTHLVFVPEKNLAVAVLTNLEDSGAKRLATDILMSLLGSSSTH